MNNPQTTENQQELFTDFAHEPRAERIPSIAKTQKPILISTTLEQLLLVSIVTILVFCLIFFLGVLRGRATAAGFDPRPVPPAQAAPPAPAAARPHTAASAEKSGVRNLVIPGLPKKENSFVVMNETPTKPYTIQVLTTKKKAYAESEAVALRKSGFNSWAAQSGDYYVVCVGSYASKEEARKDLSYFGSKYKGRYLRRR